MTEAVKKNGVNFGIIIGVYSILATVIMYTIDLKLFTTFWVGIVLFIISLVIGIIGTARAKKALGGYISFKEAFTTFFIIMALGVAISIIFNIVLFNFVDPGAKEIMKENIIEVTVEMGQKFGTPSDQLQKQVEAIQNQDSYSIGNQALSYVWMLLFWIIVGLIVAAAMKKNKPEFE